MSLLLRGRGQRQSDGGTRYRPGIEVELAAMVLDNAVRNRQPRPVPPLARLVVKKGSVRRERCSAAMPTPSSRTISTGRLTLCVEAGCERNRSFRVRQCLQALRIRFTTTCSCAGSCPRHAAVSVVDPQVIGRLADGRVYQTQRRADHAVQIESTVLSASIIAAAKSLRSLTMRLMRCAPPASRPGCGGSPRASRV